MGNDDVGWMHAEAFVALLEPLPYPLHIGEVTADTDGRLPIGQPFPYLVLWPPPATRPTITLAGYGGEATTVTQVTAAGLAVRDVITALDRATARLHRRRPTIAGRRCSPITQFEGPPQPERDDATRAADGRPVFYTFARFTLHSSPES